MSAANAIKRARRLAEKVMTDTVKITRQTGHMITDPVTGVVGYETVTVYEDKGYIQVANTQGSDLSIAGADYTIQQSRVHVPHDVELRVDDEVEVTVSPTSPLLIGRTFRVDKLLHKTRGTAHRAAVEEVT